MIILFSIIVPTYNRANLILETLETVFVQVYRNFEIIVVDNCSTDHTDKVLQPLADAGKIIYIRNDKNYERSKSRNIGIRYAKGDFLTFLDSDDFMYPNCLQDAAAFIANNPEMKFFQNMFETVNDQREKVYSHQFPSLTNQYKALANGNFISCIGGFIHREIYTTIMFSEDPRMIASEDYEVWFNILAKYQMGRINKINSGIREHIHRSVNNGAYNNLEYQKEYIVKKIRFDDLLYSKFGKYLNRVEASFLLQQVVVSYNGKSKVDLFLLLAKTVKVDFTIISTIRFYKVLYNILKS